MRCGSILKLLLGPLSLGILGGCVPALPDYALLTQNCPALTPQPIGSARPVYLLSSRLPDCRGASPTWTRTRADLVRYAATWPLKDGTWQTAFQTDAYWRSRIRQEAAASGKLLLYIHGYNNDAAAAAERAAAIRDTANFQGPVVALVWPSQNITVDYGWDEANAEWTQAYARDLFRDVASMAGEVVLVAHSMGNRIAADALLNLQSSDPAAARKFKTLVLASADVDKAVMARDILPQLAVQPRSLTLYVSRKDNALMTSWAFHGSPRAGDANCIYITHGRRKSDKACYVDTGTAGSTITIVDTTEVSDSAFGHSDFISSEPGKADLCRVINGKPAVGRTQVQPSHFLLTSAAADRGDCPAASVSE